MSGLVDREAVMEIILMPQSVSIIEQLEMLKKLPSAEPERPKGKWIPHKSRALWICTNCKDTSLVTSRFCQNCGAKMEASE